MAKPKNQHGNREGTLGWWLAQAGWSPVEVNCSAGGNHRKDPHGKCDKCHSFPHPLWRLGDDGKPMTGSEARRLELARIDNEFKAKVKGQIA